MAWKLAAVASHTHWYESPCNELFGNWYVLQSVCFFVRDMLHSHVNYCQDFYCAGSVCCEKCRNVCGCEWHWKDVPSGLLYWPVAISQVVSIKHRPSVLLSICPIRYSCSKWLTRASTGVASLCLSPAVTNRYHPNVHPVTFTQTS